jgi:hypothetical protein
MIKSFFLIGSSLLLAFTIGCAQNSKNPFIGLKKIKSELSNQGYVFSNPYNDQGRMRISSIDQTAGRSVYIYYRKDTVTEVKLSIRIKTDRDKLSHHYEVFLPFIRVIDPEGESWIKQELSEHNVKQRLETKRTIHRKYYILNYYPDFESDLLNIGIFNKDPGF